MYISCHGLYFSEKKTELGLQVSFRNLCILNLIRNEGCSPPTGEKMIFTVNSLAGLVFHPHGQDWTFLTGSCCASSRGCRLGVDYV